MHRRLAAIFSDQRIIPYGLLPTRGGALFLLGTVLIGLAAVDANVNLLLVILGFCIGGILINVFHGWRTLRALSVRRGVPDIAVAGQPFVIRYAVTHHGRWGPARSILLQDLLPRSGPMTSLEAYLAALGPGETVRVTVPAVCPVRGRVAFSTIRLSTRFPFHFCTKWVVRRLEQEMIVFPQLGRLRQAIRPASYLNDASGGDGGIGVARGDEEFYGIREYRAGDNPRRIHWRQTARIGQLMVREMAQARGHQLWCVVNTRMDSVSESQSEALESAISAAATVICDALERGARIGLICNGEPLVMLPPANGRAHRPRLLRELALRTDNTRDDLAPHIRRLTWPARWRGPCLLFGASRGEDLDDAAGALSQAVGPVTVYVPGEETYENLFRSEAEERQEPDRRIQDAGETLGDRLVGVEAG